MIAILFLTDTMLNHRWRVKFEEQSEKMKICVVNEKYTYSKLVYPLQVTFKGKLHALTLY